MTFRSLALCVALVSAAACGDSPSAGRDAYVPSIDAAPTPDTPTVADAPVEVDAPMEMPSDAPEATGRLRFVHATANKDPAVASANLDVYVLRGAGASATSTLLAANVEPSTATGYVDVPAGTVQMAVRLAGTSTSTAPLYVSPSITITEDASVTAFSAGVLGELNAADAVFRITGLADSFPAPVRGKVHVRVFNAAHAPAALGLDLGDDGAIEIPTLDRYTASSESGIELPAEAELNVSIKTASSTSSLTTLTVPASALTDRSNQYVVITGVNTIRARDPRGLRLLFVGATGATAVLADPVLYLLVASPANAAGTVAGFDAFIGDAKRFDNAAFPTNAASTGTPLKSFRAKPSAAGVELALYAHTTATTLPGTPPLLTASTGPLEASQQYLLVLQGLASDGTLALRVFKDELQTALDTTGKLRAIHALVGLPRVDVGWFDAGSAPTWHDVASFAGITFGSASQPAAGVVLLADNVPPSFKPGVRPAGDTSAQTPFGAVTQTPQNSIDRWYAVAIGSWVPATGQQAARVAIVKTSASTWTVSGLVRQAASALVSPRKAMAGARRAAISLPRATAGR